MLPNLRFLQYIFPTVTWRIPSEKKLYLTFDDGPVPEITSWVLETLRDYNARATFFCVGENVLKYSGLYNDVMKAGHSIGNHTMHHVNGWLTNKKVYFEDVAECDQLISSKLFRPPYGKLTLPQYNFLKSNYKIIMWDVLSRDYDQNLSGENCFNIIKKNTTGGSIIVFHDSIKAERNLRVALPATLKYFSEKGFTFCSIPR